MSHSSLQSDGAVYVDIDVAKHKLDRARSDGPAVLSVANDRAGSQQIVDMLRLVGPAVIDVLATGGYERALAGALLDGGLPVAMVNPGHVRHFAKGLSILANPDAIDAFVLVPSGQTTAGEPARAAGHAAGGPAAGCPAA